MPTTRIETRRGWIGNRRTELLEAVQRALVFGLKIPETDRAVRLIEYESEDFICASERAVEIEIALFVGRSIEAKRRLYRAIVDELQAFGVKPSDVKVVLHEVARENWGLGGLPGSEIDVGFKIDV